VIEAGKQTMLELSSLPDCHPTLRMVAMPSDCSYTGDVFGGWIMAQVDLAGSVPATHRAKGRVATVSVNAFTFKQPLFMGDLVSFYAHIVKVGRTSITVNVEVYAQRNPEAPICVKVTEATLVYVAVTEARQPRAVADFAAEPAVSLG
jgi:acyl-CoA thioesterase YciA